MKTLVSCVLFFLLAAVGAAAECPPPADSGFKASAKALFDCSSSLPLKGAEGERKFQIHYDFPQTLPDNTHLPWLAVDPMADPSGYMKSILNYVIKVNARPDIDWRIEDNKEERWCDAPWFYMLREPLHGMTSERWSRPKELHALQTDWEQNFAVGIYNDVACYGFGQIWGDPAFPKTRGFALAEGALSAKMLFSSATPSQVPYLYVTIAHPAHGKRYWSRSFVLAGDAAFDQGQILLVCGEIVQAVLSTFREREDELGLENSAALLASHGRNLLFRFDKVSLREGDRYLQLAYELEPRPQYLAWRAFLRNMANFQHRSCGFLDDRVELETLAQEAVRQASGSASALAIGAHIEYLCAGSPRTSLRLAERAVAIDPLNAVTYAILSNTELALDKREDSRRSALMALNLAGSGEQRAFIEFFGCMSAAALGDYQTAIDHAEASLFLRPSFVAPLRYLVALYTQMRMSNELARAVQRLRRVEPDFHPSWFLREDYPVTTMRRIRLIEAVAC